MDIVEMNKEAPLLNIISQQNPSSLDVSSTETNEYMKCNDNADMLSEDISRSSSQMDSGSISARIRELEAEQQQLSESLLSLSTKFAQVQFRIQQIASAPAEQREGMLNQLQQFASTSCTNNRNLRLQQNSENSNLSLNIVDVEENNVNVMTNGNAANMTHLVEELRLQLDELENFAWRNGHLREGDLPLSELRARQTLILERLREKMHLRVKLAGPDADADENEFRKKLDAELDEAERGLLEKDQLVKQLSTQISDLEQYVQLLQREAVTLPCSDNAGTAAGTNSVLNIEAPQPAKTSNNHGTNTKSIINLARYLWPKSQGHFEKNELKRSALFNHYGDQRAELELAVDKVIHVIRKHQILSVDREERAELTVDELNKVTMECDQEAIVSSVRKKLCPALRALLEHGLQPSVVPANQGNKLLPSRINIFSNNKQHVKSSQLVKIEARRLEHIWDVIILFLEASRAIELRDGVIGNLSDTFKLETMEASMLPHPTSKQILLSTIEYIINSHGRLKRSQDAQWKAFVCAALNRNRLPAWIRIIFRSDIVLSRCYYKWSYTARTGVEDIRPLLEGLQQFNFDLPVDLAVRPFESIKEAFG